MLDIPLQVSHEITIVSLTVIIKQCISLQCFDAVGWATGRASGL